MHANNGLGAKAIYPILHRTSLSRFKLPAHSIFFPPEANQSLHSAKFTRPLGEIADLTTENTECTENKKRQLSSKKLARSYLAFFNKKAMDFSWLAVANTYYES
jgi:hypothetical protein